MAQINSRLQLRHKITGYQFNLAVDKEYSDWIEWMGFNVEPVKNYLDACVKVISEDSEFFEIYNENH